MKTLKLLGAALAAVTMTFTAQAAKTAKAVVEGGGKTLRFVYDDTNYGTKGTAWFSVAEAEEIDPYSDGVPWCDCDATVTKVVFDPSFAAYRPKQCGSWFYDFGVLAAVDGLKNLDTSVATSMAYMFSRCGALKSLDVSGFNTAKVTSMRSMFAYCSSLTTLDLASFDTAKVTDMGYMFNGCSSLEAICVSDRFVTDQVSYSSGMFQSCSKLKGGAGTAYTSTNKTDATYARIDGGPSAPGYFTRAPTAKAVVEGGGKTLRFVYDDTNYGTKGTAWFSVAEAEAIDPYSDNVPWYGKRSTVTKVVFDPSFAAYRPKQCGSWFYNFGVLAAVDGLKNLDTSDATSMALMFDGCSTLTTLDLASFDTANVTDMRSMFYGCSSLKAICVSDRFVTDQVSESSTMFQNCSKLVGGAGTKYNSTKTTKIYARIDGEDGQFGYFTRGTTAKAVVADDGTTLKFVYDDTNYGTKGTDWFSVAEAEAINPYYDEVPWYGKRLTVTKVVFDSSFAAYRPKQCARWFYNFGVLAAVDGLKNLDTSVATSMAFMFSHCRALKSLDVSGFDTAKVTDMKSMFYDCSSLTTLNLASFDTAKVTDMGYMFSDCSSLEAICVSDRFVTDRVSYSSGMFQSCSKLVGGAETVYDNTKTDAAYARIDKAGQPGYFTRAPTAKAVVADDGETLKFVYDGKDYGTKGTDWFAVAEAEAIDPHNDDVPWYGKRSTVTKVVFDSSFAAYRPKQCGCWFYDFGVLAAVDGLKNLDTSVATSMAYMFSFCRALKSLDVSGFDTANVTSMAYMFSGCSSLEAICASDRFVTDQVSDSSGMFKNCSKLFGGAGTAYDSTKTNKTYARIDGGPSAPGYFTRAPTAKAVVADGGATLKFVYDETNYGTKGTAWFSVAEAEEISPYSDDVPWYGKRSTVTKVVFEPSFAAYRPKQCGSWFYNFGVLAAVDGLKNLDTSVATSMAFMFDGCSTLTTLDLASFDTANVTDMRSMFYGCSSLKAICVSDRFVTDQVSESSTMFEDCTALFGGAGTAYDPAKTDREYARIDGGPSAPGYFVSSDAYTIRFAAGGGAGAMAVQHCAHGRVYALAKCAFDAPTGKVFAGWRSSKNGRLYADRLLVFDLAAPGETVTMTAIWETPVALCLKPREGYDTINVTSERKIR